jgi:hypothetical protein
MAKSPDCLHKSNNNFRFICCSIFLLMNYICFAKNTFAQSNKYASIFDPSQVLMDVFECEWDAATNMCAWKPRAIDRINMGIDSNGLLYSAIDTVFYQQTKEGRNAVLVVYTTDMGIAHTSACNLSLITLKWDDQSGNYFIESAKKDIALYGAWGEPGEVYQNRITEMDFLIRVVNSSQSSGHSMSVTSLFYQGANILTYTSHESNLEFAMDENEMFENNTELDIDIASRKLTLVTNGKRIEYDDQGNVTPIFMKNEKTTYEFNGSNLEKVCE